MTTKPDTVKADHLEQEQVMAWLRAHPDLFSRHPELLDNLEFKHDTGATSLIEHQVQRLRDENRHLKVQLQHLIGIAGENQRLVQRLHRLTLEVMTRGDLRQFISAIAERLKSDFRADIVILHLGAEDPALDEIDHVRRLPATAPEWLQRLTQAGVPVCGRLTRAKLETVFGEQVRDVASAALVPLESGGLLAIGSSDPKRFFADMGTLFLELLSMTVNFRLQQLDDTRRKRA